MELADLSWTDADALDVDAVLCPVGSTEQHGPHAPLGTDTMLAEAVAHRGAATSEHEVIIAPSVPVGIAEEHRAFAGTLWLSPDTFRQVVTEIVQSVASHGWDRVVLVNGHGGNSAALREVAARVTRDGDAHCAAFTWFDATDISRSEMGHGGPIETSALLAAMPDLIQETHLEAAASGAASRWGRWVGGTNLAYDSDTFSESGVVGDPREASAQRGEQLLSQAAANLATVIDDLV